MIFGLTHIHKGQRVLYSSWIWSFLYIPSNWTAAFNFYRS